MCSAFRVPRSAFRLPDATVDQIEEELNAINHGLRRQGHAQRATRNAQRATRNPEGRLLGNPATRPGITGVAYDTAWLAGLPAEPDRRTSRFPTTLRWLADNQLPDGSWGSAVRYEHDRILCTLDRKSTRLNSSH